MPMLPFDYAVRNAGRKPLRTVLTTLGAAAVVFLVILMGAFVQTLGSTMRSTGEPGNVIVLGAGSEDYLEQSEIRASVPTILSASVGSIAKHYGQPLVSPEIHHATFVSAAEKGTAVAGAQPRLGVVRGVTPMAFAVHQKVFITQGQLPGGGEVLAGKLAAVKLGLPPGSLRTGGEVYFEGKTWRISGMFDSPGTAFEAELWAPLEELKVQTKRDELTCVVARLASAQDFAQVDLFCKTRLDLNLAAVRETTYYGALAHFFQPVEALGWTMAVLVVVSGLFGGLNTMVAAVASRSRELACLETLGFGRTALVVSLLEESLLQVAGGALIAAVGALGLLSGKAVRFSMSAAELRVDAPVLAAGVVAGVLLAVGATLIPALRQMRTPLVELLRS